MALSLVLALTLPLFTIIPPRSINRNPRLLELVLALYVITTASGHTSTLNKCFDVSESLCLVTVPTRLTGWALYFEPLRPPAVD